MSTTESAGAMVPVHTYGIPGQFLEHASRGQVLESIGLTPDVITTDVLARITSH